MATPRNHHNLQEQEIEAHRLLTQSMNLLSDRIEKTETDFIGHLKKVEDRLDQIVDLTKTVAVLQQQTMQTSDRITEVGVQLRDYSAKFDTSISRIHTRLDELKIQHSDKLDSFYKELSTKIDIVEKKSDSTEKELKQWLNRGWGVWAVATLIFGLSITTVYRWIDSVEKEKLEVATQINSLMKETSKIGIQLDSISPVVQENKASLKRLDQMVVDNERQIEYLRNKK